MPSALMLFTWWIPKEPATEPQKQIMVMKRVAPGGADKIQSRTTQSNNNFADPETSKILSSPIVL